MTTNIVAKVEKIDTSVVICEIVYKIIKINGKKLSVDKYIADSFIKSWQKVPVKVGDIVGLKCKEFVDLTSKASVIRPSYSVEQMFVMLDGGANVSKSN